MMDPDREDPFEHEPEPEPEESHPAGEQEPTGPPPGFPDPVEFTPPPQPGQPHGPPPGRPPGPPQSPLPPGYRQAPIPGRYRGRYRGVPDAIRVFYLDLGKVLGQSISIYFKNIFTFTLVAVLVYMPILACGAIFYSRGGVGREQNEFFGLFVYAADTLLLTWVLTAGLVYGVTEQIRGRRPRIDACLRNAFVRVGPVLVLGLLTILAYIPAVMACIVPALLLMCVWYVAFPVCVVERPGIIRSLKRSSELTRGSRWAIFGLLVIMWFIGVAITLTVTMPLTLATSGQGGYGLQFWVAQGIGLFIRPFQAVVPAVVYHELRVGRENVDIDELAAVFE